MTDQPVAAPRVGVASFDLTPAPDRLWGRLRGLALVVEHPEQRVAIVAVDGARVPAGVVTAVETALGWPTGSVVIWPGGPPVAAIDVQAVADAIAVACARQQPGAVHLAVGPAWGLRCADPESPLLAGQRLERSHRQLRSRAADDKLEALVARIHGEAPPPGTPWGHLLVDQRVGLLEARDAAGRCLGALGWLPGTDPFAGGGWPSAGIRGALARRLSGLWTLDGAAPVPVVVVGPEAPGLLGGIRRPPRDAVRAREFCERGAESLAKVMVRLQANAQSVDARALGTVTHAAELPSGVPVEVGRTTVGPLQVVHLPGTLTDGMVLRLSEMWGDAPVWWLNTDASRGLVVHTPREAHQVPEADDQLGPWLTEVLDDDPGPAVPVEPTAPEPEVSTPDADGLPDVPTPHVVATLRRGHDLQDGGRHFELAVRFRTPALLPPGNRWQVRLEWERKGAWTEARVQGQPVDDLHQGMRVVAQDGRSGRQVQVRWTVAELRRWTGRRFRVRIGPAYGGPFVSAPFKLK